MRARSGVVLVQNHKLALIERHRGGQHYFSVPGGGVESGETPEQAAIREALEELGVHVVLQRLLVETTFRGNKQYYFLARITSGIFGSGLGIEMQGGYPPEAGTYKPIWLPVDSFGDKKIVPPIIANVVRRGVKLGWPEETIVVNEDEK